MSNMRARLEAAKAPSWLTKEHRPVKGDILSGEIVNISTGTSDFGDYTIITVGFSGHPDDEVTRGGMNDFKVKTADGEVPWTGGPLAWHAIGTVAANEVERANPAIGDRIGILYDGSALAQKGQGAGKSYEVFRVAVDRVVPVDAAREVPATPTQAVDTPAGYAAPDEEMPF
jgi:hypothetical protein